ncbi:MAG: hypothetical protein ABI729_05750 [Chitinophagales bacterium]
MKDMNPTSGITDPTDNDPEEQLREENELLRIKIQAQFGGHSDSNDDLPPEIENEFLKNVLAFEEQYSKTTYTPVKVSTILGDLHFKKSEELNDEVFKKEWKRLNQLLEEKSIGVDFLRPRDDRFKYKFITEELFEHETDGSMIVPHMNWNFIYEEFHPDHEQEITDRAMDFLKAWFEQNTEALKFGVVSQFIQPDTVILTLEELLGKMQLTFDSYVAFKDCKYKIFEVKYELHNDEPMQGIGHAEGMVKYEAILENGETRQFEGPFKFYMTREYDWWSIFYFVMPGFEEQ